MSHGSLEDYAERAVRDRLRLRLVPLHEALETVLPLAMRSVYRTLAVMIATGGAKIASTIVSQVGPYHLKPVFNKLLWGM
ncbi:hypothetical protein KXX06_004892, partial [Aspergillus fumigatus]